MRDKPESAPQPKKPGKRGPKPLRELIPTENGRTPDGIPDPVVIKNPVGRPTKYDPKWMLDKVIEVGRRGGTHAEMAIELGIARETFYTWRDTHEDFLDAIKIADAASQVWWERAARNGAVGLINGWNPTTYIFHMKNRFRHDYKDKPEVEVNIPVQMAAPMVIDSRTLTPEQRFALRQALLAARDAEQAQTIEADYEDDDE